MKKIRITYNAGYDRYRIQWRSAWWPFWSTPRWAARYFGGISCGPKDYKTLDEAKEEVKSGTLKGAPWEVVYTPCPSVYWPGIFYSEALLALSKAAAEHALKMEEQNHNICDIKPASEILDRLADGKMALRCSLCSRPLSQWEAVPDMWACPVCRKPIVISERSLQTMTATNHSGEGAK